ncbi:MULTISPECIES: hypothetical protein [unclassified Amycolatopsis]|uniref:hypothetical protein n=1 Tax=unclassified Amycolatopsis TaxID=2618356 RepID=UPI0037C0AD16
MYHLLHTARRCLAAGDRAGAAAIVGRALAGRRVDELQAWHRRLLLELAATGSVVPGAVVRALSRPTASVVGPEPGRRELRENLDVDPNDWWS